MKKNVLPLIAALAVIAAAVVLIAVPKGGSAEPAASPAAAESVVLTPGETVDIRASQLSGDRISLFRVSDESKVELIAIQGADGRAKVALATCQSCNGSPRAYYSQTGDQLQCNNCGLTFPLSVIGEEGSGCHPIMLDETKVTETDDGVSIDRAYLLSLEPLFAQVAEHG